MLDRFVTKPYRSTALAGAIQHSGRGSVHNILRRMGSRVVIELSRQNCRLSRLGSMMKRMSFSETIFLFVLALVIFGPKKLPEIARQAGKLLNEFRRASNEFKSQIEQEIAHLEVEDRKKKILPPSAPPEGTASRGAEPAPVETPATLATPPEQPQNEPIPVEAATEAVPPSEPVAASTNPNSSSQESHA